MKKALVGFLMKAGKARVALPKRDFAGVGSISSSCHTMNPTDSRAELEGKFGQ